MTSSKPLLLALGALSLAGPALAQSPAPAAPAAPPAVAAAPAPDAKRDPMTVVARVNGEPITEADVAVASEDPAVQSQPRETVIGYLVDLKLGAKAAAAAGLGESPEFARRVAYLRDKLLVDEYLDRETAKAVTPEAARKFYDEAVKSLKPEEEVRARHILVEGEDAAKAAAARVKAGEDFAKVAGELSTDPGSKTDGGDLGFFAKDRMVPAFAEAAFKLQPGEVSEPVKSQFGWHVIRVDERRAKPVPSFEDVKDNLERSLTQRAQQEAVLALRAGAKIERLDAPAAAPAQAPGASAAPAQPPVGAVPTPPPAPAR